VARGLVGCAQRSPSNVLLATQYVVDYPGDPEDEQKVTGWWTALTDRGGEGTVVKPRQLLAKGKRGLVQPALKCRRRK